VLTSAYIILTGGLHFDGLADTCDGVFSGRSREQSLEIMKDSRIGVFGMLGIFMTGLFYFALFTEAPMTAILIFPLCGRACCLISASIAPYARGEGMGKATSMEGGPVSVTAAIVSLVGASFLAIPFNMIPFAGYSSRLAEALSLQTNAFSSMALPLMCSLIAAGAAVLTTIIMTLRFEKKLGGVTGDTFGAVIEVSSIVYLLVFTILYPVIRL
jgi:adenosylcobinamide-GDP ribazoletransferase